MSNIKEIENTLSYSHKHTRLNNEQKQELNNYAKKIIEGLKQRLE